MALTWTRVRPGLPGLPAGDLVMVSGLDLETRNGLTWEERLTAEVNASARTITTDAAVKLAYMTGRFGDSIGWPLERHVITGAEGQTRTMGEFLPLAWEIPANVQPAGQSSSAELVGRCTDRAYLRAHFDPNAAGLDPEERTRRLYVLAAASYAQGMLRWRTVRSGARNAGVVQVVVVAGLVVVGLYAVSTALDRWVETTAIEAARDERIAHLRFLNNAHKYDARIKAWFNSGDGTPAHPRVMPPPDTEELGGLPDVRRRGESFWEGLGDAARGASRGLESGFKWAAIALGLYFAANAASKR